MSVKSVSIGASKSLLWTKSVLPVQPLARVIVCVQSLQSCLTLCNPMDYSTSGSSTRGILQARILEWVAIPSSRGSSQPRDQTGVSCTEGRFFNHLSHLQVYNKGASQVALVVKNPPANSGVIRAWGSVPGRKGNIYRFECRVPKNSKER